MDTAFWRKKTLEEMSSDEWEQLCDGCGKCCLSKLENDETGEIYWTSIGCRLLDAGTCQCSDYANRKDFVPDCVKLTPEKVRSIDWLPATCAYSLVADGQDLAWWHHLISGSRETVHQAGISMRNRVTAHDDEMAGPEDFFDHVLDGQP